MSNVERTKYLRELHRNMVRHFDTDELQLVAFHSSIDWDELKGNTKSIKAHSLIMVLARHGRLNDLLLLLLEERPKVQWPIIPSSDQQVEDEQQITPGNIYEKTFEDYLEKIKFLLSKENVKNLELYLSSKATAQAYTYALLPRLDKSRRLQAVYFLLEENYLRGEFCLNLRGIDLSSMNLSGIDLHEVDLQQADFSSAYLDGANLAGANLYRANFKECSLNRANLAQTNLTHAKINNCSMIETILDSSNLSWASLEGTQIIKAQMQKAKLTKIENAVGANFYLTDLTEAEMHSSSFNGVYFNNAIMVRANLQGCNFIESRFHETNLSEADLRKADLTYAHLEDAILRGAKLQRTKVKEDELHKANLDGVDLVDIDYYVEYSRRGSSPESSA